MFYLRHFLVYFLLKPSLTPESMRRNTPFLYQILSKLPSLFQWRYLKFLFLLFTLCSFLLLSVFPLFCLECFLRFSIRHVGSSFLAHPIQSKNIETFQPIKRRRCSQSNVTVGQMRALPEIQRFLFTNKHFNGFRNGR